MQSLSWYYHRVRKMSPGEVAWRLRAEARELADRARIPLGLIPKIRKERDLAASAFSPGFRTTTVPCAAWARRPEESPDSVWADRLKSRADAISAGLWSFFNLENVPAGDPIDWQRDAECGKPAPRRLSQTIDYRDYRETGDAKVVWEPNRHHQLVVLGRAYRAFGEPRYAEAVMRQMHSWIESNPFGYGMNWRSPLELAIRLINWVWALDLVRGYDGYRRRGEERIRESVWRHLWEISRKFSRGSSSNNHLVGEAAGVFIASSYFPDLPGSPARLEESHEILAKEIFRQTHDTGCTREQALGYHFFVLQFFLLAGIVGRRTGTVFSAGYWDRLERMFEFGAAMADGGALPMFGDCDDGYVLDLAGGGWNAQEIFAVGAILFDRPDFRQHAGASGEAAYWLAKPESRMRLEATQGGAERKEIRSRSFPDSGHYLLQTGHAGETDRVSLLFDCAELGFTSIAAHGHADALSFTLRVAGRDVFVDPGTYDYFTYPEWRSYFRSTAAHNTVEVDDRDQSEMLGPFLWGRRAEAECVRFETEGKGGVVCGAHDGYAALPDPVRHVRSIEMDGKTGCVKISDEIRSEGTHDVRIRFHAAEDCSVRMEDERRIRISADGIDVALHIDAKLSAELVSGRVSPIAGWVSRGYHRKSPATTIVLRGKSVGNSMFRCDMEMKFAGKEE